MNIPAVIAIIGASCAVTCGLLFAVHRLGRKDTVLSDTTRGAAIYAVLGTSFAVLLAFVVLISFQSYDRAKSSSEAESEATLSLFRAAEYFPPAQREKLQGQVVCYGRAVVADDWPAMEKGERSPRVDHWSYLMQHTYPDLQVGTPKEQAAFSDMLDLSNDRLDARRQRLTEATPIITTPVWFILGLGAMVSIGFVLVFIDRRDESLAVQLGLMACVTAVVSAGLLLIWFLDHPYEDANGSIKPTEMRTTLGILQEEDPSVRPPCTEAGEPL